jgi:hypothetical protein
MKIFDLANLYGLFSGLILKRSFTERGITVLDATEIRTI